MLKLLNKRKKNQQYIKRRNQKNKNIALTIKKLHIKLKTAKSKLNKQHKYYKDIISNKNKHIAKLKSNKIHKNKNQFLIIRHPKKTPIIKHCTNNLKKFLQQLIKQNPLITINIITHRYYKIKDQ